MGRQTVLNKYVVWAVVSKVRKGHKPSAIARELGVDEVTVRSWCRNAGVERGKA